jgi:hypothetical protein
MYNAPGDCYYLGLGACKGCGIVLGDVFLASFVTIFDRHNAQVGFSNVAASCRQTVDTMAKNVAFFNTSHSFHAHLWTALRVKLNVKEKDQITNWSSNSSLAVLSTRVPVDAQGYATNYIYGQIPE